MEVLATLAIALGASWCAGINLYATVGVLGLMHRFTGFDLPPGLEVLAHDIVLWPALFMYLVEFVADKVPAVDSVWDVAHTFLRIPAGAAMAAAALGDVPPEISTLAAIIGGGLALTSHGTKATTRVATHLTGNSLLAPIVSVVEDGLVIGTVALVATHPVLSMFVVILMMVAAYYLMRMFWKVATSIIQKVKGWLSPSAGSAAPA